jgi:hypothetical protein
MYIEATKRGPPRLGVVGRKDGRWRWAEHIPAAFRTECTYTGPKHCIMQLHDGYGGSARQTIALDRLVPEPEQRT